MAEIICKHCKEPILLGQNFVRTKYDKNGKMVVEHTEHTANPKLRSRILTEGRVVAIETYREGKG